MNNKNYLIKQFCDANGYNLKKLKTTIDNNFYKEVSAYNKIITWLKERQLIGERYVDFLNYLGLDVKDITVAEVNKSLSDSITLKYNTKLITPYTNGLPIERVIPAYFIVNKGNPSFKGIAFVF